MVRENLFSPAAWKSQECFIKAGILKGNSDCFQKKKKNGMHFRNRASKCAEKKESDVVQEYYLRKAFQRIQKYRFLCCWH